MIELDRSLHAAIVAHNIPRLRELLSAGASIEARDGHYNYTPLLTAAGYYDVEVTRLLLKHGADINAQDKDGDTALHIAVRTRSTQTVKLLLEHGAQMLPNNQGRLALSDITGHDEEMQSLLLPTKEEVIEISEFRTLEGRTIQQTFNFRDRERLTLVRDGARGKVEAICTDPFAQIEESTLRRAFAAYAAKGGKIAEAEIFADAPNKKTPPQQGLG